MGDTQDVQCTSCSFGEILLIGEELRTRMHMSTQPVLIRDHRYRMFQVHRKCFAVNQAVTWLVECGNACDRRTALKLLTVLRRNDIIHQVGDDSTLQLKDDSSFCRFRSDDGTFKWCKDVLIYRDAQNLYSKLSDSKNTCLMRNGLVEGRYYKDCFYGDELITWMMKSDNGGGGAKGGGGGTKSGGVTNRKCAVSSCRLLLQNHLIGHIYNKENFKDEHIVYQFIGDMRRSLSLINLLTPPTKQNTRSYSCCSDDSSTAQDIPRQHGGRLDSGGNEQCNISSASLSSYSQSMSPDGDFGLPYSRDNGVLIRKASISELTGPSSQFRSKVIKIKSDEVGFGFVIRGNGPVFVKILDPTGPAALAGLKVGHYLLMLNEVNVLTKNQKELAHMILEAATITLTVLEHFDAH